MISTTNCWTTQHALRGEDPDEEPPVDDADLAWYRRQRDGHDGAGTSSTEHADDR